MECGILTPGNGGEGVAMDLTQEGWNITWLERDLAE